MFNIAATATPMQLAEQFAMYGDIKDVREDPQVQGCWLLEYYDIRHAAAAYKALNRSSHSHATLPVVSESTADQGPQPTAPGVLRNAPHQGGLRNVQSSHVLNNPGSEFGGLGAEDAWQGSRSWDNKTGAAFQEQLASFVYSRQNGEAHVCCIAKLSMSIALVSHSNHNIKGSLLTQQKNVSLGMHLSAIYLQF